MLSITALLMLKIFYIETKAVVAQKLLAYSWQESKRSKKPVKPWKWADINPVGSLRVPRLGIHQIILNGHNGEALAFGPGQIKTGGSIALAGHRDSHFEFLKDLKNGDRVFLENVNGKETPYTIEKLYIQDLREVSDLTLKENILTLVTCYPFDKPTAGGPLRYIVEARPLGQPPHPNSELTTIAYAL